MTESTWFLLKALFLGVIEGFTEFIPVSSTAPLLLIGSWINFTSSDDKVFEVVIQFGSILAVMWIFRQRLLHLFRGALAKDPVELAFMRNLLIAFLPAAVIGALAIKYIKMLFHSPMVFVFTLIVGGIIMLWVERKPQYAKFGGGRQAPQAPHDGAPETAASRRATSHALKRSHGSRRWWWALPSAWPWFRVHRDPALPSSAA